MQAHFSYRWPTHAIGKGPFELLLLFFRFPTNLDKISLIVMLKGILTLFGNFIKSQKVSSHQLNSKMNDLVLLLKTIWM